MTRDFDADLDPSLPPAERAELLLVAEHLSHDRPLIRPAARGDIRRRLAQQGRRRRPVRLWRTVAASAVAGTLMLGAAAINLVGAGPLAPDRATGAHAVAQAGSTEDRDSSPPGNRSPLTRDAG